MNNEGTEKPGKTLSKRMASLVLVKLGNSLQGHVNTQMHGHVPIACRLLGVEKNGFFSGVSLGNKPEVFVYFESIQLVKRSGLADVQKYLSNKEPWEDYDICVFDESFGWFIGYTHNELRSIRWSGVKKAQRWWLS